MPYVDFPEGNKGMSDRKKFWTGPDGVILIDGWRKQGMPLEQIATEMVGVQMVTLWRWSKEFPSFRKAIDTSKQVVDDMVVNALLQRALGYEYDEDTWELVEGELRKTKVVRKHVSPDVKACLSWLYSRQSQYWRIVQPDIDTISNEIGAARKVLVAIKEVADGNDVGAKPEAD